MHRTHRQRIWRRKRINASPGTSAIVTPQELRQFCAAAGIAPSAFGRRAVRDPRLIQDMLNGRQLRPRIIERLRAFMSNGIISQCSRRSSERVAEPDPILADIEAFLADTPLTAAEFGMAAIGDPSLVRQLRTGREPRRRTCARIRHYIEHGED